MLDELLPKATGKEARVEKKRVRAEQRKEREMSPGIQFCSKTNLLLGFLHYIDFVDESKVYGTRYGEIVESVFIQP